MQLKKYYTILFFLIPFYSVLGQGYFQTVSGRVYDIQSKEPLSGATITIKDSNQYIIKYTDDKGYYTADSINVGRVSISAFYQGYLKQTKSDILLIAGKQLIADFELYEKVNSVKTVKIKGGKQSVNNKNASVSARSFNIEDTRRFAGARNDPARMASNFAGVVGNDDSRNDIIIRGNSPLGVLWRLEGVDIPNPNHFGSLGSTGGPVGIINNNSLAKSDFLTGAFPAMYGNANAGVFDLKLKAGNYQKTEFTGQVGFNGFELGVEGPFSKNTKASYMMYYRYSAVAVIQGLGLNVGTGTAVPYFQDLVFKANFPGKKGDLSLFAIGGKSNILFEYNPNDTTNFFNDGSQQIDTRSQMGIAGANYKLRLSKKSYAQFNFNVSSSALELKVDTFNALSEEFLVFNDNSRLSRTALHSYWVKKINAKNKVTFGNNSQMLGVKFSDSVYDGAKYRILRNEDESTFLIQNYATWKHRFLDNLALNLGLNHQYFALNNSNAIEPRAGITYHYLWKHKFAAAFGMHHQLQPMQLYYVRSYNTLGDAVQSNKNLDFTRSMHYVLSYDYRHKNTWNFKFETYFQNLSQAPVDIFSSSYSALNEGADFNTPSRDSLVNNGSGRNIGAELTIEKFLKKGKYLLTTLSIFDSKFTGSDNIERNTAFNGGYVFNVLAGKEFKINDKHTIALDLRVTSAGGRRYTPIDFNASLLKGEEVRIANRAFELQYPNYFRTDLKITYRQNFRRISQEWFVDLQNISNHKNVFQEIYNPTQNKVITQFQIGFFPNINYRINF